MLGPSNSGENWLIDKSSHQPPRNLSSRLATRWLRLTGLMPGADYNGKPLYSRAIGTRAANMSSADAVAPALKL